MTDYSQTALMFGDGRDKDGRTFVQVWTIQADGVETGVVKVVRGHHARIGRPGNGSVEFFYDGQKHASGASALRAWVSAGRKPFVIPTDSGWFTPYLGA